MIVASRAMREAVARADRLARTTASVWVRGETGTGKELVARRIHEQSGRAGRFVPVNCGAIAEDLAEGELFGHVKGTFTGAVADRDGLFQRAHEGTLFLDEVAELSLATQVKLLRATQEGAVRRVGAADPEPVDVRLVVATNRDLAALVERGEFREDLFWRVAAAEVALPPLRERPEDALAIARHLAETHGVELDAAAEGAIARHPWPGNVRQLEEAIKVAAATGRLSADDVERQRRGPEVAPATHEEIILAALEARGQGGTITRAEVEGLLGLSRDRSRVILSEMVDDGIIESRGESVARCYAIAAWKMLAQASSKQGPSSVEEVA